MTSFVRFKTRLWGNDGEESDAALKQGAKFDREEEQLKAQHEKELAKIRAESALELQQMKDDFDTQAKQTQLKQAELADEAKHMEAKVKAQLAASTKKRDELLDAILNAPPEELNDPDGPNIFKNRTEEIVILHNISNP